VVEEFQIVGLCGLQLLFKFEVLAGEEVVPGVDDGYFVLKVAVVEGEEVDGEAEVVGLHEELDLRLELLSQEGVLAHDLLGVLEDCQGLLLGLVELGLEQVQGLLVAHQQRLDVVQLLEVGLRVDDADFGVLPEFVGCGAELCAETCQL
jgi:hypothetical protein